MIQIVDPIALGIQPIDMSAILTSRHEPSAGCSGCEAYRPEPQRSGNLQVDPEIHLPGPMPLDISYYYNAASTENGAFGYGRTISPYLTAAADTTTPPILVTLTRGNGSQVSYIYYSTGAVAQTPGCLNSLTSVGGYFNEITPDGTLSAYLIHGSSPGSTTLAYMQDSVGNITTYNWSLYQLNSIEDPVGRIVSFGYSGSLLSNIEDWAGRRTTFQYDTATANPLNLLTTVTGPTGCQTVYQYATFTQWAAGTYSSNWFLSGILDPNGFGTSYVYDMQGRVNERTIQGVGSYNYLYQPTTMMSVDPLGGMAVSTLDDITFALLNSRNQLGQITTYTRNASLQELSRQLPTGGTWSTVYDGSGRVTSVISPLNHRTSYSYDTYSNILSVQTPDGAIVTNIYGFTGSSFDTTGAKRRLQAQVNQLGNITSMGYTALGQAAWIQDPAGFIVTINRDSFGNPISRQDSMGGLWSTSFDLAGNPLTQTNPLNAVWSQSWDNQNRPLVAIDPMGNTQTNAYDSVGNRTVAISPLGFRTSWVYNAFDKVVSMQDSLNNMWTSVYDVLGNQVAAIDPLNNRSTTIFDAASRPIGQMNPIGAIWSTILDAGGRPVASQTPLGFLSSTVWDLDDRRIASVDALNNRSTLILDANGRTIATQNPLNFLSSTIFDAASQPIARIDANNNYSSTVFDPRGLAISQIDALNRVSSTVYNGNRLAASQQDPAGYISTAILDSANRNIANQDARGYLSSTVFDAADRPIASINALNFASSTSYDSASNPIQTTDPLNRISTRVFDALNRTVASISPLGYINTMNRDAAGRQISTQNEIGALYTSVFDAASRQIATVSPLGFRTSTVFDVANQPIANQDSLGFLSSTIWDAAGRRSASVNPLNFRSSVVYDQASQQVGGIDALGNRVTNVFLPNGWQSAVQNELGFLTSFIRDAAGQQICVVDANNGRSTTVFTNRGLVLATQDQLGALTSFTQDANGNTILRVDARNWPTSYTVDALNRTASQIYIDGTRVTNTWDSASQQITSQDVTGITSYVWDNDSRKTATQNPTGINLTNTLDGTGNRLVLQDSYGVTSYVYDVQSRLTKIQNPLNEVTSIQWDSLDRELHRVLGNGMTVSHTFDGAGRETLLQNISAAGVGLAIFTNAYSPVDNRLTVLELSGILATYTYDASSQILSEARGGTMAYNRSYVWDPLGNRIQRYDSGVLTQGTFNAANQQTLITPASGPPTTQTFDSVGNLTLQNTGGALVTSTWSPENRLSSYVDNLGNSVQNLYSDDGQRRQRTKNGATSNLIYDETILLIETDTSNNLQVRYTTAPGTWGGLTSQNRSGASSFYGLDSQTSARILVSIGGTVTDSYSWKAFGEAIQTGSGTANPYGYVANGAYYTELVDLVNAWNRWPRPSTGQWRSVDPIGFRGGDWNLYRYVFNSPTNLTDATGTTVYRCCIFPGLFPSHCFMSTNRCGSWGLGPCAGASQLKLIGVNKGCIYSGDPWLKPLPGHPGVAIPGAGVGQDPTEHVDCEVISTDPAFEKEACSCIERSRLNPPDFIIPTYVCITWTENIIRCACEATNVGSWNPFVCWQSGSP